MVDILALAATLAALGLLPPPPVVETECGAVIGATTTGSCNVFRSIPYSVPPTGTRRWQPPQPLAQAGRCWAPARLNATRFRSVCFQSPKQAYVTNESEDCLHLTVWQPLAVARNASAMADVVVFFHGGDLTFGSANFYDMSLLAADGAVVVVSVNYRLNLFGFLAAKELAAADRRNASGNYGLLDMQESLRWVQRNIRQFHGNPDSVTILG